MPRRDFQVLADLRAKEADILVKNRQELGAYYLGGYAIECALKARIAKKTKRHEFPPKKDYVDKVYTHKLEALLKLAELEKQLEEEMKHNTALAANWVVVKAWNENSRYSSSGLSGKDLLKAIAGTDGVLPWITTLVKHDREVEGRVLEALSRARVPVKSVVWDYVQDIEEWQLFVATPLYDSKGPLEALSRIIGALKSAGVYEDVNIRRVAVLSPNDNLAKTQEQKIMAGTEGAIHIVSDQDKPDHEKVYSVIFAPFTGKGGFVPARHISGQGELRKFLADRLHIRKPLVDEAFVRAASQR